MNPVRTIDTALIGLGNVNRNFLRILEMKQVELARRYALAFRIVCVADSSGVAVNPDGFDPAATRQAKEAGQRVCDQPGYVAGASPAAGADNAGLRSGAGGIAGEPDNGRTGAERDARRAAARDSGGAGQQGTTGAGLS